MSFATAFLGQSGSATIEQRIAKHLEVLLQSISPERSVGRDLQHVQASNLCFGLPMNWAVNGGARDTMIRQALQQRLARFEPRIKLLSEIEITVDKTIGRLKAYQTRDFALFDDAKKKVRTHNKQVQQ